MAVGEEAHPIALPDWGRPILISSLLADDH